MADTFNPFCSADEVAAMLRVSRTFFYERRAELHALGMPHPLPHFRPWRFPRAQVERWILDLANGYPQAQTPRPASAVTPRK